MSLFTGAVMLLALAVSFGVGAVVRFLHHQKGLALNIAYAERLAQACQQGAALAYGIMAESGVAGATPAQKASAIALGVQHVLNSVPEAKEALKASTNQVQNMVLARYGGLLAADPTVTVGPGPIIAAAMTSASRLVAVQPPVK